MANYIFRLVWKEDWVGIFEKCNDVQQITRYEDEATTDDDEVTDSGRKISRTWWKAWDGTKKYWKKIEIVEKKYTR